MPPRDSRTVSDVEAEKKAARKKRVKVKRAPKRADPPSARTALGARDLPSERPDPRRKHFVTGEPIDTRDSLGTYGRLGKGLLKGAGGLASVAAEDVPLGVGAGRPQGPTPSPQQREYAKKALDLLVGPNIRGVAERQSFDPKWLIAELGLLPFAPLRPLTSVSLGTRALRGAKQTGKAIKAVTEGEDLGTAARIAAENKPILRVPSRRRRLNASVQEIAAARSRTGRVAEAGIDKARPTLSKVPFVKTPEQVWARDAERRIVHDSKREALPGVLADSSIKRLNRSQKYALYALGTETSPRMWRDFYLDQLEENGWAMDQAQRAAVKVHIANFNKAMEHVSDEGIVSRRGADKLQRAYDHLRSSSEAREGILERGGYLDPDTIVERRSAPGRIARGAKWTPEDVHASNVIRQSPQRESIRQAMRESGISEDVIDAQLNVLDTHVRAAHTKEVDDLRKRQKQLEREVGRLLDAEAEGDEIDEVALRQLEEELAEVSETLEQGVPYDAMYSKLNSAETGFPEWLQSLMQMRFPDVPLRMAQSQPESLFDMPAEEAVKAAPTVTREALQAKHQGQLPPSVSSRGIAEAVIRSGAKLPEELQDADALASVLDEIYENVKGGTDGRFWYDLARRVSEDIAARYDGRITQDQAAQVIAIYSQAADTVANMSFVREAIDQFMEHGEIYAGRFPERQSEEAMRVLRGEDWEGRKRSSFYANIMSDDDERVTVDRWVTRWFTPDKDTPVQFYDAYEMALQLMAKELGWKPKEVQAAAWVTSKKLALARRRPKWTIEQVDNAGADAYNVGFERYFGEQGQLLEGGRVHPNAKRVANLAKRPDGGGTLRKDLTNDTSRTGYIVAHGAHEQVIPAARVNANLISAFRDLHLERLDSDKQLRVGIWHNPENGRVYFDLSRRFNSKAAALAFAREQGQLAIWDVKNFRSVETGLDERTANIIKTRLKDEAYGAQKPLPVHKDAAVPEDPDSPRKIWDQILEGVAVGQGYVGKNGKINKGSIANAELYIDDWVRNNPDHPTAERLRRLWHLIYAEDEAGQVNPEELFGTSAAASMPRRLSGFDPINDDLLGLPTEVKMGGEPLTVGASPELRQLASQYMDEAGLEYTPPTTYAKVDEDRATRIADEYERMLDINDPSATPGYRGEVYRSYRAFADETMAQYRALERAGYTFEFYPEGADPYPLGPRQAIEDLKQNRHLYVFPSEEGFGMGDDFATSQNPLLEQTDVLWAGRPTTVNDIFRAVHDVFGHGKEGVGFRADGEENAWRSHVAMYSDEAKPAMTSETRGQNSWVNYGPHGATNRNASQADTVYAEQKAGIMPEWTWKEGAGDGAEGSAARASVGEPVGGDSPGRAAGSHGDPRLAGISANFRVLPRDTPEKVRGAVDPGVDFDPNADRFLHGVHTQISNAAPARALREIGGPGDRINVSKNTAIPTVVWAEELSHFWHTHFPGAVKTLTKHLGDDPEAWASAYLEYVLDLYPQRALPRPVRDSFDKLSAAILREADATGGVRFVARGMPRELAEFFDTTLWYKHLEGGALRGAEDFTGGTYTAVERGFPVSLRHPLASTKQRLQALSGLFQGRTGVKGGFKDPTVKKHFTGRSVESGWIKIANLGKAQYNALLKAIRMDNVQVARAELLKASTDTPSRADDIAVFVNPSQRAPAELKRFWETVEQMGSDIDVNQLSLREVDELDKDILDRIHESAFPSEINGQPSRAVAQEIIEGMREPIDGIRWVSSDAFHASELFSAPSAFFNRSNSWGRMEAGGKVFDTVNDLMKLSLLPLNPAYAPMNLAGNLMLNLMQQGPFALMNLPRAALLSRELGPDVATAVDYYMGRGIMHLGETEIIGRNYSATASNWLGRVIDVVPRRAAFLHEAWAMGFRSSDDIEQLLGNESFRDELYEVIQRANDAIIDYERLSPFERKYLQRILFIYPWIRGATRYTYRFPMEHPIQAMAFALAFERQQAWADERLGKRPWYAEFDIPIGEVERFGEIYPLVLNPKQLVPFTTPVEMANVLTGWASGSDLTQAPIESLQPFWTALVTSITGYDTFAQREVGRGPGTFLEQVSNFPLRQAVEDIGKSEEELEDAATNRIYPRNRRDTAIEIGLGSLAPTPYNPEKGQFYAEGKRGQTPEERMREKQEQIRGFYPDTLQPQVDRALETKVEYEHAKDARRKELGRDDLSDIELAEVMIDLATEHVPGLDKAYILSVLNAESAGPIRSELEAALGWGILEEATTAANAKARADEAKAEGSVVSSG